MLQRALFVLVMISFISFVFVGPAFADFAAGKTAYDNKEWPKAIAELKPLADKGDAHAAHLMGNIYSDGSGVLKDPAIALRYYKAGALKNNPESMLSLAAMYQRGLGVEKNAKTAAAWFGRAANLGDPVAAFFYGISLFQGDLSKQTDFVPNQGAAYKWFLIAGKNTTNAKFAKAGNELAKLTAGRLTEDQRTVLKKEAEAWKPLTADKLGPPPSTPGIE